MVGNERRDVVVIGAIVKSIRQRRRRRDTSQSMLDTKGGGHNIETGRAGPTIAI
jgi:hypothetical protein